MNATHTRLQRRGRKTGTPKTRLGFPSVGFETFKTVSRTILAGRTKAVDSRAARVDTGVHGCGKATPARWFYCERAFPEARRLPRSQGALSSTGLDSRRPNVPLCSWAQDVARLVQPQQTGRVDQRCWTSAPQQSVFRLGCNKSGIKLAALMNSSEITAEF